MRNVVAVHTGYCALESSSVDDVLYSEIYCGYNVPLHV